MTCLVPEFLVSDHDRSLAFHTEVLSFRRVYGRDEDGFEFLDLNGVPPMLSCADATRLRDRAVAAGFALFLPAEERWYQRDDVEIGVRRFIVQDVEG